jgi:hypothetical protein
MTSRIRTKCSFCGKDKKPTTSTYCGARCKSRAVGRPRIIEDDTCATDYVRYPAKFKIIEEYPRHIACEYGLFILQEDGTYHDSET